MTRRTWRLTRRGRVVAWIVAAVLLIIAYRILADGYESCMAAGHAWADCAML